MPRLQLLFVLLVALEPLSTTSGSSSTAQKCGANEKFVSCGTACPLTCSKPHPQTCSKNCVVGCQCKTGFLMNSAGACVNPPECQRS
ncbi:chymotrypsin inhibitor-like [Augochlora pura]